jgi:hypothetical protein|tara:strand:+ start:5631 stop:5987 length:357 start_codon:yes stop_codon:yes gene_type:complete
MKKILKYAIKLLFVIILPLVVSITVVTLMISSPKTDLIANDFPLFVTAMVIILLLTIFNAIFYSGVMSKTKLLPDIDFEVVPVIGLAIGYDQNRMRPQIMILLPFLVIEIKVNKKFKK